MLWLTGEHNTQQSNRKAFKFVCLEQRREQVLSFIIHNSFHNSHKPKPPFMSRPYLQSATSKSNSSVAFPTQQESLLKQNNRDRYLKTSIAPLESQVSVTSPFKSAVRSVVWDWFPDSLSEGMQSSNKAGPSFRPSIERRTTAKNKLLSSETSVKCILKEETGSVEGWIWLGLKCN